MPVHSVHGESDRGGKAFYPPPRSEPLAQMIPLHPRVIALINGKGGVGKTSIAANIGGLLAADGLKVLIMDLDFQGNLALDLGMRGRPVGDPYATDQGLGLLQAILSGSKPHIVRNVRPNLDVVPGGKELRILGASLHTWHSQGDNRMSWCISLAAEGYDVVLLDCPPGDQAVQKAALRAARWLLVPVRSDEGSRDGLGIITETVLEVRQDNPDLDLLGVVHFGVNMSSRKDMGPDGAPGEVVIRGMLKEARDDIIHDLAGANPTEDHLRAAEELLFGSTIRYAEKVATACRKRGLLVHEIEAAQLNGAKGLAIRSVPGLAGDYAKVAEETVNRIIAAEESAA